MTIEVSLPTREAGSRSALESDLKALSIHDASSGLTLIPFNGSETEMYETWFNRYLNPEVMRYLHKGTPYTTDENMSVSVDEFVQFMIHSLQHVYYRINHRKHGFVGHISLNNIDYDEMSCWLGIVIGEQKAWGQGIASNAVALLLDYLRNQEFREVRASAHKDNDRSRALLTKYFDLQVPNADSVVFVQKL